jgi:hypothetical protein
MRRAVLLAMKTLKAGTITLWRSMPVRHDERRQFHGSLQGALHPWLRQILLALANASGNASFLLAGAICGVGHGYGRRTNTLENSFGV